MNTNIYAVILVVNEKGNNGNCRGFDESVLVLVPSSSARIMIARLMRVVVEKCNVR